MSILFAWLGNTDLRASEGDAAVADGPILNAIKARDYARIELLTDHATLKASQYIGWLAKYYSGKIEAHQVKLSSPTSFEDIYRAADNVLGAYSSRMPKEQFVFHLSPGTPAMAAVWIILAKSKYPAELIESSREQGVRTVSFPFELAAEFLPSQTKEADEALSRLVQDLPPPTPEFDAIIHRCDAMKRVVALARRLAARDVSVLIQGESGTGKELFARAIHQAGARQSKPFVAVNCGAIPSELVDSELFGHEKGAFTGATTARAGYFEATNGGTLFLDEVGELPLASQVRLLRVLQEREVTRVGTTRPVKIDIRVIAATNRALSGEVQAGRFREDLFHRLAVGVLMLPPLRERPGDIGLLLDMLLGRINREASSQPGYKNKKISVEARKIMLQHGWAGNIRELHNALLRASIWAAGNTISASDVKESLALGTIEKVDGVLGKPFQEGFDLSELISEVARHYLARAMMETRNNKTEAAKLLGLPSYQTLSNWLQKYGVGK